MEGVGACIIVEKRERESTDFNTHIDRGRRGVGTQHGGGGQNNNLNNRFDMA